MAGSDAEVGRGGDKATREWERIARGARGKRDWRLPREIMIIEDFCSILKHSKAKEEFDLTKGSQRKNLTEI